jgi:hypothetical protein
MNLSICKNSTIVLTSSDIKNQNFKTLCKTNNTCDDCWRNYVACLRTCFPDKSNDIYVIECPILNGDNEEKCFQILIRNIKYYFVTNMNFIENSNNVEKIINREECILLKVITSKNDSKKIEEILGRRVMDNRLMFVKPIPHVELWQNEMKIFGFSFHPNFIDDIFQMQDLT